MNKQFRPPARRLAMLGILAALTAALSMLEGWLPPLPVPLARLGLSNVTVTLAAWTVGPLGGVAIGLFKVGFALLTRGTTAAMMAGGGTVLSVAATLMLLPLVRKKRLTFVGVHAAAAAAHTLGQLVCASVLLSAAVWSYGAVLMAVGTVSGMLTGLVLNALVGRLPSLTQPQRL